MTTFDDLTTSQLRQVIRNYNFHTVIPDYGKKKRKELLAICKDMFDIDNESITLKQFEPLVLKVNWDTKIKPVVPIRRDIQRKLLDKEEFTEDEIKKIKQDKLTLEHLKRQVARTLKTLSTQMKKIEENHKLEEKLYFGEDATKLENEIRNAPKAQQNQILTELGQQLGINKTQVLAHLKANSAHSRMLADETYKTLDAYRSYLEKTAKTL